MPLLDDFNRADNASLGANWTANPFAGGAVDPDIVSNQAKAVAAGYSKAYWNVQTFGPDCYVEWDIQALPAGNFSHYLGLFTALGASCTGYQLGIDDGTADQFTVYRSSNNATDTVISGPTAQTTTVGDRARLALVGTQVRAYYKVGAGAWSLIATVTDNTYRSASTTAILNMSQNAIADNFSAGDWRDLVVRDYQKPSRVIYLRKNV